MRRCERVVHYSFMLQTLKPHSTFTCSRPETTTEILQRALALCPDLAPPEVRAQRAPTVDDLRSIVIEEGCGFRPSRKGGVRLDVDWVQGAKGRIPLVFNYG
jgi:D-amino-acid oxidase